MKIFFASILLMLSVPSLACDRNEHGVFEDISCAAEAVSGARTEMESLLRDLGAKLRPEGRVALDEAQKAWEQYRAAAVAFVYAQEGDGSAGRLVVANDTERAIRARTLELQQWLPQ